MKKAKNLRGTGLTRKQQIDRVTGREGYVPPASTDAATRRQVEKIQTRLEEGMSNGANIKRLQEDVKQLRVDVEKLKDGQRGLKLSNGNQK